jgi:hypothetical protein
VQTARRLYYGGTAMNDDPLIAPPPVAAAPPRAISPARLWVERLIIVGVAGAALLAPLALGFAFFLATGDGLRINAGDPLREARLWMIQEKRGATGLALSISQPAAGPPGTACARARVHFLKWDAGLRREPDAVYCQCYERRAGAWTLSTTPCQP